ncbi:MAG: PfkB family carbohydrate kinase [Candidatus Zixiibacteriota bacterium]
MHKIAVLGTITRDTVIYPDSRKIESFGGILYNILALSYLGKRNVKIYPACNLGCDIYDSVLWILKKCKNVDIRGIRKVKRKNNHNFLIYDKKGNRDEISRNSVPELTYSQLKPFLNSDVILVNFISGKDIDLKTLKKLKKNTSALIFMDIHSLILGKGKSGKRFVKVPKNWLSFTGCADVVQCNFFEFSKLSNKKMDSSAKIKNFARSILRSGPQVLLVTNGKINGYVIQPGKNGVKVNRSIVPKIKKVKDLTGCGDVFSAAFLLSYLKSKDPVSSANFANSVATYKCRFPGIENLSKLTNNFP